MPKADVELTTKPLTGRCTDAAESKKNRRPSVLWRSAGLVHPTRVRAEGQRSSAGCRVTGAFWEMTMLWERKIFDQRCKCVGRNFSALSLSPSASACFAGITWAHQNSPRAS
eukprot:scaffold1141_cov333-Pavlova_lutheri.AAC.37